MQIKILFTRYVIFRGIGVGWKVCVCVGGWEVSGDDRKVWGGVGGMQH